MTTFEQILQSLAGIMGAAMGIAGPVPVDEPEPSRWVPIIDGEPGRLVALHAGCVQPPAAADLMAFVRSGDPEDATDELELEAVLAYGVQIKPGAGQNATDARDLRRSLREAFMAEIAYRIRLDPTLQIDCEVFADLQPPTRTDDATFANGEPTAVALIPVRVLYTATSPAG